MHRFQRRRDAIQAASSTAAVDEVMMEYGRTIPEAVAASLPPECQRALKDPDIQSAAVGLLHCELGFKGDPEMAALLHEVAHTYAAASLRITRLTKEPAPKV